MTFRLWHHAAHQLTIIRYQRYGLWALVGVCAILWLGWVSAPKQMTVYVPPDLSGGITQSVTTIPKAYVYSFAYQLWQELNYWPSETQNANGQWAAIANLETYWSYLTDDFRQHLLQEANTQARTQKLSRTRALHPLQGASIDSERVTPVDANTWRVQLDVQIVERANGILIKDTLIRYDLYVTQSRISPSHNPYGLVLAGFASPPKRLVTR